MFADFSLIFNVFDIIFISAILTAGLFNSGKPAQYKCYNSVQARSPIWANEEGLARTRERAAKQRGAGERGNPFLSPSLARFREAHFACPNRRACSQASVIKALWYLSLDPTLSRSSLWMCKSRRPFLYVPKLISCSRSLNINLF